MPQDPVSKGLGLQGMFIQLVIKRGRHWRPLLARRYHRSKSSSHEFRSSKALARFDAKSLAMMFIFSANGCNLRAAASWGCEQTQNICKSMQSMAKRHVSSRKRPVNSPKDATRKLLTMSRRPQGLWGLVWLVILRYST